MVKQSLKRRAPGCSDGKGCTTLQNKAWSASVTAGASVTDYSDSSDALCSFHDVWIWTHMLFQGICVFVIYLVYILCKCNCRKSSSHCKFALQNCASLSTEKFPKQKAASDTLQWPASPKWHIFAHAQTKYSIGSASWWTISEASAGAGAKTMAFSVSWGWKQVYLSVQDQSGANQVYRMLRFIQMVPRRLVAVRYRSGHADRCLRLTSDNRRHRRIVVRRPHN